MKVNYYKLKPFMKTNKRFLFLKSRRTYVEFKQINGCVQMYIRKLF